ncbi:MAG: DUF485 domain-containing protein [Sulfurimonas sp.]|uniref:DUF485 domain-containing protein n=1 Tax=Sulfurimonas sp. TaxID=2022749 RepID=UPI0028CE5990|nr:DUF485 domain-containing protein [Sulfurimonas sp.]MDT8338418.1 DUF485 domain-containing protein [Sulfurimonas sp.]
MQKEMVEKIKNDPNYQELVSKRSSFSIKLTITMLVVYFAFILTIAFEPSLLGTPLSSDTVTTVGIPVGMAVIFFAFILTGIYTKRANGEFDDLNNKIKESVREK